MIIFSASYWIPFTWGLVILVSWVGWGEVVRRLAKAPVGKAGWGLRAVWGMAAVLAIGGVLIALGICTQAAMTGIIVVGVAVCGAGAYRRLTTPRAHQQKQQRVSWVWWVVVLLAAYCYATSVVAFDLNWWDDLIAYLPFAKKLMQTGGMIEPFALRRMVTFGGQQLLDGMLLCGGNFLNVDILELGLGQVMVVGMVLEFLPHRRRKENWVAAVAALVLMLVPRGNSPWLNTNGELTAAVLMMGLVRTLKLSGGWKIAMVAGMVGAGLSTMRANLVPAAVLAIGLTYAVRMLMERSGWRRSGRELFWAAAGYGACLLGWSAALYFSSGTFFYPLWRGNQQLAYYDVGLHGVEKLCRVAGFAGYPAALALLAPLLLGAGRRFWKTEGPIALAAVAGTAATLLGDSVVTYVHIYRYVFPLLFGTAAVLVVRSCAAGRARERLLGGASLVLIAALNVWPTAVWLFGERSRSWREMDQSPLVGVVAAEKVYENAQEIVPAGAAVLSATSFPLLLDSARNRVFVADIQGVVSPPPGMPVAAGGAAVRDYLLKQGIGYVMYTLPEMDRTQYSRAYWEAVAAHPEQFEAEKGRIAERCLQFMQVLGELEQQGKVVYRGKALRVVELQ